jgi:hypothetical protein
MRVARADELAIHGRDGVDVEPGDVAELLPGLPAVVGGPDAAGGAVEALVYGNRPR